MSATRVLAPTCPVSSCHALHLNRLDTDVQVAKWRSLVAFLRQSRATCHVTQVCVTVSGLSSSCATSCWKHSASPLPILHRAGGGGVCRVAPPAAAPLCLLATTRGLAGARLPAHCSAPPGPILQTCKKPRKISILSTKLRTLCFVSQISALASFYVCKIEQNLGFSEIGAKHRLCRKWQTHLGNILETFKTFPITL